MNAIRISMQLADLLLIVSVAAALGVAIGALVSRKL